MCNKTRCLPTKQYRAPQTPHHECTGLLLSTVGTPIYGQDQDDLFAKIELEREKVCNKGLWHPRRQQCAIERISLLVLPAATTQTVRIRVRFHSRDIEPPTLKSERTRERIATRRRRSAAAATTANNAVQAISGRFVRCVVVVLAGGLHEIQGDRWEAVNIISNNDWSDDEDEENNEHEKVEDGVAYHLSPT